MSEKKYVHTTFGKGDGGGTSPISTDSLNYFMIPEGTATSTRRVEALWTFEN